MAVTLCAGAVTRRRFLTTAASSGAVVAVGGIAKPALSRAADRPIITHGIQSGDVSVDSGVVWARADRPARMLVEVATSDSFKSSRSEVFVDALPETDFTAKALIEGLPAGQDIFYRVRLQDHSFPTVLGAPQVGHFRTAPSERRSVSFVWSGDTAGGGWGIDEGRGGMRTYSTLQTLAEVRPGFFSPPSRLRSAPGKVTSSDNQSHAREVTTHTPLKDVPASRSPPAPPGQGHVRYCRMSSR